MKQISYLSICSVSIDTPFTNHKDGNRMFSIKFNYDQSLTFITNLNSAIHLFPSMLPRDLIISLLFIIEV